MKVSLVVPAFNEQKLIQDTLRHIKRACEPFHENGWEMELIVCDNNSRDATAAIAQKEGAHVVFEPINQIGRARNTGAAAATGDWLIFVDADSHPSPELFGEVAGAISSGCYLAGGCTVRLASYGHGFGSIVKAWNALSRLGHFMAGSFIFCERLAFQQIGGFDLKLFAKEEIDLSRKLKRLARRQGKKIIILHRYPLLTSDRKIHLYSRGEMWRFLVHNAFSFGNDLTSAEKCFPWYDGRR